MICHNLNIIYETKVADRPTANRDGSVVVVKVFQVHTRNSWGVNQVINNIGLRLLKFARSHCLTLANTLHPQTVSTYNLAFI